MRFRIRNLSPIVVKCRDVVLARKTNIDDESEQGT